MQCPEVLTLVAEGRRTTREEDAESLDAKEGNLLASSLRLRSAAAMRSWVNSLSLVEFEEGGALTALLRVIFESERLVSGGHYPGGCVRRNRLRRTALVCVWTPPVPSANFPQNERFTWGV
ncbi:hypothetical protein BaRGS_00001059 [Batillaria attramentaria]|uniref:Uncharacterized protein n=1 Tax=Batillaria attramentaria TaxID=370345 RepID=A0ABD0M5A2_9CAEN